ncbi:general stress protein [Rothia sp. P4278]|uniref:general stress protein n=1 Tax=Rothia sp. P4278 TaxID=3402658 RepID=UPI003AE2ED48
MDQLNVPPALALSDGASLPPGELVATFNNRKELNRALEFLASQKFPVHSLYVVGHEVRQVDYITGQATYPRAALGGAVQGVGLGTLVGFFNAFVTNTSIPANLLSIVPLAIAFCMIYSVVVAARAKGRGIRTRTQMLPARLDLMAIPATAQAARNLLRVSVQPAPQSAGQPQAPRTEAPGQNQNQPGQNLPPSLPAQGPSPQQSASPAPSAPQHQPGPQWFDPHQPLPPHQTEPQPFLPGFNPADQAQQGSATPEQPAQPVFTPPAQTKSDGTKATSKYGLRVETPEEFEAAIRKTPTADTSVNERIEQIRAEQSEQRYGLRVETPEEFEAAIRREPEQDSTRRHKTK